MAAEVEKLSVPLLLREASLALDSDEPGRLHSIIQQILKRATCYDARRFVADPDKPDEANAKICRMAMLGALISLFSQPALRGYLSKLDQEGGVNQALLKSEKGKVKAARRIKEPFREDEYIHEFVDRWYAEMRYDVSTYGSIVVQLPGQGKPAEPGWPHKAIGWVLAHGWAADLAALVVVAACGWIWDGAGLAIIYAVFAALAALLLVYLVSTRGPHTLKALVPRLAATTVVGMVAPTATADAWRFSFVLWGHPLAFVGIAAVLLAASWAYLFIETENHVQSAGLSFRRSIHILLRLLNFGWFLSWWATTAIVNLAPSLALGKAGVTSAQFGGEQLRIALAPFLLFGVVCVFIGIFLQVLWHDRPITGRL